MTRPLHWALAAMAVAAADHATAQTEAPSVAPSAFSCAKALEQAETRVAAAVRLLRDVPACPKGDGQASGEGDELRQELQAATAESEGRRLENERLHRELDEISASRLALVRTAILSFLPVEGSCETLVVEAEGTAGLVLSGRVRDPVALRARVDDLGASATGVNINYSGLSELDVCGVPIKDAFIAEADDRGVPKTVRREDVGDELGGRVPRAEECTDLGAALATRRAEEGADWMEAFWVLRARQDPATPNYVLCRYGRNTEKWVVYEANLSGQSGLLIVKPE